MKRARGLVLLFLICFAVAVVGMQCGGDDNGGGGPSEVISAPSTPSGDSSTDVGQSESYSTGGAASSLGHSLEYRFDWGDGNYSSWASSTGGSHAWSAAGTYTVKAQARCASHTDKESPWSAGKVVSVAAALQYTIDGYVRDGSGNAIAGVTIARTGGADDSTTTDANGYYVFGSNAAGLNYTLTPSRTYYTFDPPSRTYNNLGQDWHNEDYTGTSGFCDAWQQLPMTGYTHVDGKVLLPQACQQGYIYATAGRSSEGDTVGTPIEVWRFDGVLWTLLNTPGFGDPNNILTDNATLTIYRDSVYVATDNEVTGVEVWRYHASAGWRQANTDGFGDGPGTKSCDANFAAVYQEKLYVVTVRCPYNGIGVWSYDGLTWEDTGFDDGGRNELGGPLVVRDGLLYMGTRYEGAGGEIWAFDGSDWTAVMTGGFGDRGNYNILAVVYDGALLMGTVNETTGGEVWRYDGDTFTQICEDGFGDPNSIAAAPAGTLDGGLFVGVYNGVTGHQVWMWNGDQCTQQASCALESGFPSGAVQCGQFLYIAIDGQLWKVGP